MQAGRITACQGLLGAGGEREEGEQAAGTMHACGSQAVCTAAPTAPSTQVCGSGGRLRPICGERGVD